MSKLSLILLIATLFIAVECIPYRYGDIASAAAAGDWDDVHRQVGNLLREIYNLQPLSPSAIRELKQQRALQTASALSSANAYQYAQPYTNYQ